MLQPFHLVNQNQVFVQLLSMQVEILSNLPGVTKMRGLHIHHLLVRKTHVRLREPIQEKKRVVMVIDIDLCFVFEQNTLQESIQSISLIDF